MPLETPAKNAAERLLLLTETLNEAVLNERLEEIDGILASRQAVIDQIETLNIDSIAAAILAKVGEAEEDLIALMVRTQGEATTELVRLFSGSQQTKAYKRPPTRGRLLRTG